MAYLFILSTLSCLVDYFASFFIKLLTMWYCSETPEDQALRNDLKTLKKEMNGISMVDEFAKYAKLQRKYNKLEEEAKKKINSRSTIKMKIQLSLTYGLRILNAIFTSCLLYQYRREPVVIFPKGCLWPLESFFSWPSNAESCISLPMWIILMRLSVSFYSARTT